MNNSIGNLDNGVIYAVFGLLVMTVGAVIWMVKFFANRLSRDLQEHTKAATKQTFSNNKLAKATQANTEASEEMIAFMKNLNGRLAKATSDTLHQTKEIIREAKK